MEMKLACSQSYNDGIITNNHVVKRRRTEDPDVDFRGNNNALQNFRGRKFIPLRADSTIFQSEDIKGEETLFLPFTEDILINMDSVDQISFGSGNYFIGNEAGTYVKSAPGHLINLWRYDFQQRRLYIARSFLFTHLQNFVEVKAVLESI